MKQPFLKKIIPFLLISASLSACAVERRVERPRGCRHGVWVERHHGRAGYWRCEEARHRDVIIVK
jgi:hypothetical protein